jgi:uncharacterized RDD family membrane protein YckC
MNSDNPFRAPSAAVVDMSEISGLELAGRGHRFGASVIDGVIAMLFMLPLFFALGIFSLSRNGTQSFAMNFVLEIVSFAIFILLQSYFLKKHGQTIGKKIVGIRIVDLEGNVPSLRTLLFRRYAPMHLINGLPVIGGVLSLIDVLFIFGSERRCIHDLIAKTKVVLHGAKYSSLIWFLIPLLLAVAIGIGAAILIPMLYNPYKILHAPVPKPAASAPQKKSQADAPATASIPATPDSPTAGLHNLKPGTAETTQPSTGLPAAAHETAKKQGSDAELSKCLELKDPAAVIRCSEANK